MADSENLENESDMQLLKLSLAGEENAFHILYGRLKGGIFRYAFYMTNSVATAEEVTQEVFLCLLRDGQRYREQRGDVSAFAFGVARNFLRRIGRRERAYEPLPGDAALEKLSIRMTLQRETVPSQMIRNEAVQSVQRAIASLPDHYRQVVVLCDLCELSYADTATRLNCAVGTVRSRLNRAHLLLAEKLLSLRGTQGIATAGPEGCLI